MRIRYLVVLIGMGIAACSEAPLDDSQSLELEPPPALTATERGLGRLAQRRQEIIESDLDEESRVKLLQALEQREAGIRTCSSDGGRVVILGSMVGCFPTYDDGGKVCSDSAECEGKCVVEEPERVAEGVATTGTCQAEAPVSSCYSEIANGIAGWTLCVN